MAIEPIQPFAFPSTHSFPPFYTLQPNTTTRAAQLQKWSLFIQRYCQHHRVHRLTLVSALETPLFHNTAIKKRLSLADARTVIDFMVSKEGDGRASWIDGATKSDCYIWWRRPEEWATLIASWVEETGQKGSVLTLYEIVQGETTERQQFYGMDMDVLRMALATLVKKGKAQIFGVEGGEGVKFF